ncbi:MAG: hypothetical protein RMN51_04475 [Verrucomicrobiota bacterium]|nr:hypothetical protein [Limisphaera sp.]MDW8381351.1 hypothetical protein [Verrucomicrobiota bacterium]
MCCGAGFRVASSDGAGHGDFTLVELMGILVVLGALAFLLWGPLRRARSDRAITGCRTHLMQLLVARPLYAHEASGRFPRKTGTRSSEVALQGLVPSYLNETRWIVCPATKDALLSYLNLMQDRINDADDQGRHLAVSAAAVLMSDEQVDCRAKDPDHFSLDGRGPGNNCGVLGDNLSFTDGSAHCNPPRAAFAGLLGAGMQWLNLNR